MRHATQPEVHDGSKPVHESDFHNSFPMLQVGIHKPGSSDLNTYFFYFKSIQHRLLTTWLLIQVRKNNDGTREDEYGPFNPEHDLVTYDAANILFDHAKDKLEEEMKLKKEMFGVLTKGDGKAYTNQYEETMRYFTERKQTKDGEKQKKKQKETSLFFAKQKQQRVKAGVKKREKNKKR